jgi:hypothetical protein
MFWITGVVPGFGKRGDPVFHLISRSVSKIFSKFQIFIVCSFKDVLKVGMNQMAPLHHPW